MARWVSLVLVLLVAEYAIAAEKIRDLMKTMGGPPPCCDDSIFERAGMTTQEP